MADDKDRYSDASFDYVTEGIHESDVDMERYRRSKARESAYNENWKQHMVDINDVVHQFAPNSVGQAHGVKYQFESDRYIIKADMASGYLRIYDKVLRQYVRLDGTPGSLEETHFKIKKRSEM